VTKRWSRSRTEPAKSRYAIVADGGSDPEAAPKQTSEASVPENAAVSQHSAADQASAAVAVAVELSPTVRKAQDVEISIESDEVHGLEGIDEVELERRKTALAEMIDLMRPAVQMDGGDLEVIDVDYEAGIVEVQLQGACGSCAISSTTLQGGVERLLKERLEWVNEVHGGVDDSVDPYESAALGRGAYVPRYY